MKPIIKKIPRELEFGDKIVTKYSKKEVCGKCQKRVYGYWKWCPYCGEKVEREV